MEQFYSYSANSLRGENISMSDYKGKVVLVVNTASKCGLTPQYEGLEELHKKYAERGLVILGFPCNQFGNQEPGDSKDISEGCLINYGVSFQMFEKIEVNGANTHPLYEFLKKSCSGILNNSIKWNFTKFIIDTNGVPVKRFAPQTEPAKLESTIEKLL